MFTLPCVLLFPVMTSPGTRLPRRYTRSSTTTLPSSGMLQTSKQRPHLGNHDCSDRAWCIVERPSLVWFASRLTVLRGDCDDVTHTHTHRRPTPDGYYLLFMIGITNRSNIVDCSGGGSAPLPAHGGMGIIAGTIAMGYSKSLLVRTPFCLSWLLPFILRCFSWCVICG